MPAFGESCRRPGHAVVSLTDPKRASVVQLFCVARFPFDHLVGTPEQREGTVRPSAFAVFVLMINSMFVDCWTGRSPRSPHLGLLQSPRKASPFGAPSSAIAANRRGMR
jgi:hypothetical protein